MPGSLWRSLIPAMIVLFSFFIEGSMDVWSVIYLRRTMDATALAGAGGFALFSITMAVGRSFAARLLFGLGYQRTILFAGFGSLAGSQGAGERTRARSSPP